MPYLHAPFGLLVVLVHLTSACMLLRMEAVITQWVVLGLQRSWRTAHCIRLQCCLLMIVVDRAQRLLDGG
jgi:hypothetical protein